MRYRTTEQNKKLHTLLGQLGLMEEKKALVRSYSGGRTESSRELYLDEARRLIEHLERQAGQASPPPQAWGKSASADRMRKKIIAICYAIGWIEHTDDAEERKVNMARIDLFLKERGYLKKPLMAYTSRELPRLVSQFEQIQKHQQQSQGSKAVQGLLSELNIPVLPAKRRR